MLLRLAIENPGVSGKFKIAAGVVTKKGRLIATGVNSYKTHPIMLGEGYKPEQIHLHAEVDAIKNALRLITQAELSKCSLYVVRVKKDKHGNYVQGLAKPCKGCSRAITSFGIQKVEWTLDK